MWSSLKSSFAFWFGLSFVFAAIVALPFSAIEKVTHERLLAEGEVTEAAVVDRGQRNDDEDRSHWLKLTYFDLSLKEFTHQQAVPKSLWDKHPIGSTIRVRYLRDDPQKVTPEALLGEPEWKTLLALGITFAAIGVPMVALAMVKARRTARA
jgi:hypothetical protein